MTGETSFPEFLEAAKTLAEEVRSIRAILSHIAEALEKPGTWRCPACDATGTTRRRRHTDVADDVAWQSEARLRNMEGVGNYEDPRNWPHKPGCATEMYDCDEAHGIASPKEGYDCTCGARDRIELP